MERAGGQGSAFLNQRSDVVSERGRGGEHGESWDTTRHRAPVAGRPVQLIQNSNTTAKIQAEIPFSPIISPKPIDYLFHQLHRCVELQEYSNFP